MAIHSAISVISYKSPKVYFQRHFLDHHSRKLSFHPEQKENRTPIADFTVLQSAFLHLCSILSALLVFQISKLSSAFLFLCLKLPDCSPDFHHRRKTESRLPAVFLVSWLHEDNLAYNKEHTRRDNTQGQAGAGERKYGAACLSGSGGCHGKPAGSGGCNPTAVKLGASLAETHRSHPPGDCRGTGSGFR